ncbi:MAG: hypothetical protein WCO44_11490 [Bacteroidota bacterium]
MKKIILLSVFLITLTGFTRLHSQSLPFYPIPSSVVTVDGAAVFREEARPMVGNPTKEKRVVNVEVKAAGPTGNCTTTVWVYSLDHTSVLGPFSVGCGETLTVGIDEREWGVLVESDDNILVNVWIDGSGL